MRPRDSIAGPRYCPQCGYDLHDRFASLQQAVCPECGSTVERSKVVLYHPLPRSLLGTVACIALVGAAVMIVASFLGYDMYGLPETRLGEDMWLVALCAGPIAAATCYAVHRHHHPSERRYESVAEGTFLTLTLAGLAQVTVYVLGWYLVALTIINRLEH